MGRNPYASASSTLFYGREETLRELITDEQNGRAVVLLGGRRCGKSRQLEQLAAWLRAQAKGADNGALWPTLVSDAAGEAPGFSRPRLPVIVDLQGHAFASLEQALGYVGQRIVEAMAGIELEVAGPGPAPNTRDFEAWLLEIGQRRSGSGFGGLALLFDGMTHLLNHAWSKDLMSFLRLLTEAQFRSWIWLVIAGSDTLDRYRHLDGSHALNTTHRTLLSDLSYSARRRMIVEPFVRAGKLPPTDETQRFIDLQAGGHAWLLSAIVEAIFDRERDAGVAAVRRACEEILDAHLELFRRWSSALDDKAWEIYAGVAAHGRLAVSEHRGSEARLARRTLIYHSLVHRVSDAEIEIGPELFRRWAEEEGKIKPPFARRTPLRSDPPPGHHRYDVALSYAGPQRALAQEVAGHLQRLELETFYDQQLGHELWGLDLERCLPASYDRECRLAVLLVSKDYLDRPWPKVEARAAIAKACREGWEVVLIVSVDGARLEGVPGSVVILDLHASGKSAGDVALEIQARLKARDAEIR